MKRGHKILRVSPSEDQQLAFCDQTPCEPRTLICRIPNALDEVGMGWPELDVAAAGSGAFWNDQKLDILGTRAIL